MSQTASQLGMVGLGRMGANMTTRLRQAGIVVVGFDQSPDSSRDVDSLAALVEAIPAPRAVWVMVPAGVPTDETVAALADLLSPGDIVVDGGNTRWTDSQRHGVLLAGRGVSFLDVGVSGGVWGLTEGFALMVGGATDDVVRLQPVFEALKPPGGSGFVHAGPIGAGHFTKMVHNGIEYGLMQAYAEGYELLAATPGLVTDVPAVFASWQEGTVVRSWLLDLLVRALDGDHELTGIAGVAADSGEGRWTLEAAIDAAVPMPVLSAALFARFASRQEDSPAMKVVAALRQQFGGHTIRTSAGTDEAPLTAPPAIPGGAVPSAPSAAG